MGWFGDLIERIDKKIDHPADQTAITNPRKRRSMRMLDQMKDDERRRELGLEPEDTGKVRGGAGEKNSRQRGLRW